MADKPKSLDGLFNEEESVLTRRHRERLEREQAFLKTPEGQAEAKLQEEARAKRAAERENQPDEDQPDEDEDEEDC